MKFSGTITAISPVASGTSKSGKEWRRIDVCLTYDNSKPEYPKAIVFSVMNDNIEKFALQVGAEYSVEVDFSVREYQGRHYMSASCWRTEPKAAVQQQPVQAPAQQQIQAQPTQLTSQEDDFPF